MTALTLKLNVLPIGQRQLWQQLGGTPQHFVLYGGTALALRLGHRQSVDFDFFSHRPFRPLELAGSIPYLKDQTITQQSENTLSCDVETAAGVVKVSYFGSLKLGQLEPPDIIDNAIALASLRDVFATKCATVFQRNEVKDYLDIHAALTIGRLKLADGLAGAKAIYGRQYDPILTLQALSYFDDLREPLAEKIETDLTDAVKSVSLLSLPTVAATNTIGRA